MNKYEFVNPRYDIYNPNELNEIKALRKIIFHLIREIHVLRETQIQNAIDQDLSPKDSTYGKLYKNICVLSHNSSGPFSGQEKILCDWFSQKEDGYDELLMLSRLGYTDKEVNDYIKKIEEVSSYT